MISSYVDVVKCFCEVLKSNINIEFEKNLFNDEFMDISDNDLIETINMFKSFDYKPDKKYYDFFRISNMSYSWSYTNENNQFIYGGFLFNGILDLFVQNSDFWDVYNSLNHSEPTETELAFLRKLNWFEKQAWGDDGKFGCFLREPGAFPPPIYFYDSGAYFPMNLSLEEYFDAMIASCAVRGWQYFYINFPPEFPDLKKVNCEKVYAELERTVQVLPKLFPERDFTYHKNRFEEIKGKLNFKEANVSGEKVP